MISTGAPGKTVQVPTRQVRFSAGPRRPWPGFPAVPPRGPSSGELGALSAQLRPSLQPLGAREKAVEARRWPISAPQKVMRARSPKLPERPRSVSKSGHSPDTEIEVHERSGAPKNARNPSLPHASPDISGFPRSPISLVSLTAAGGRERPHLLRRAAGGEHEQRGQRQKNASVHRRGESPLRRSLSTPGSLAARAASSHGTAPATGPAHILHDLEFLHERCSRFHRCHSHRRRHRRCHGAGLGRRYCAAWPAPRVG